MNTRRLSIVIALPKSSPLPSGFGFDRFGTESRTARWRRERALLHLTRGTPSRRVKPVTAFVVAFVPGTTRKHATPPPTALQDERPPFPELLLAALSQCARFQLLGRPWPSAGNHPGTHTPSPIRGDLPRTRHVARGCYPSGLAPHVPSSRSVAVAEDSRAVFAFRGQNTEAPPLPVSAGSSPFGTVSCPRHQQGLASLSWLSSSPRQIVRRRRMWSDIRSESSQTSELPTLATR